MAKSISQFRAEVYVTNGRMAGWSCDQIDAGAAHVKWGTGGETQWFRKHVARFCEQLRRSRAESVTSAADHQAHLRSLIEIDGCRLEKGRFGSKKKKAWRVWLKTGGHALVYLDGRTDLTPEQAQAQALAQQQQVPA